MWSPVWSLLLNFLSVLMWVWPFLINYHVIVGSMMLRLISVFTPTIDPMKWDHSIQMILAMKTISQKQIPLIPAGSFHDPSGSESLSCPWDLACLQWTMIIHQGPYFTGLETRVWQYCSLWLHTLWGAFSLFTVILFCFLFSEIFFRNNPANSS